MEIYFKVGLGVVAVWFLFRRKRNKSRFHCLREPETGDYPEVPLLPENFNGFGLRFLSWLSNTQFGDMVLNRIIMEAIGISKFRNLKLEEPLTFFPFAPHDSVTSTPNEPVDISGLEKAAKENSSSPSDFRHRTAFDYVQAYRNGAMTPLDVAKRIIDMITETNPTMKMLCDWHPEMIIEQAKRATDRYIDGDTLSPIDGTFCVVKDQISVAGHTNRNGLSYINKVEDQDADIIKKVRSAGVIIVGISNMTELGMSVFGANPSKHHGTCRNPMNPAFYPGGSSSGTAAAICSGLVPFGIGTDGGGSIRMPSSMTGIVGLKTTFSRVSANGNNVKARTCCSTVASIGPMASNVIDMALFYQVIAGAVKGDPYAMAQPKVAVPRHLSPFLDGIKIGVDWKWAKQSRDDVFINFQSRIDHLAEAGAQIVQIEMPELDYINIGHIISIVSEGSEACREAIHKGLQIAPDNGVILNAAIGGVSATDFVLAAKYRTRLMNNMKSIFEDVDVIANPSCAQTAERIIDGDEPGVWKFPATLRYMLYVKVANYSGIPALTVPSGFGTSGLPTGIMLQGKWYDEEMLMRIGYVLDLDHKRRRPQVYTDLLS